MFNYTDNNISITQDHKKELIRDIAILELDVNQIIYNYELVSPYLDKALDNLNEILKFNNISLLNIRDYLIYRTSALCSMFEMENEVKALKYNKIAEGRLLELNLDIPIKETEFSIED